MNPNPSREHQGWRPLVSPWLSKMVRLEALDLHFYGDWTAPLKGFYSIAALQFLIAHIHPMTTCALQSLAGLQRMRHLMTFHLETSCDETIDKHLPKHGRHSPADWRGKATAEMKRDHVDTIRGCCQTGSY